MCFICLLRQSNLNKNTKQTLLFSISVFLKCPGAILLAHGVNRRFFVHFLKLESFADVVPQMNDPAALCLFSSVVPELREEILPKVANR